MGKKRKLGQMNHAEMEIFRAEFPFSVPHLWSGHGTDHDRKLVHAFFANLHTNVFTTTNRVWFQRENDMILYQLGMWK
jgi:hypothetical protein